MSKNQSRKGYVVGALVALVSTLFTVAPAQADATGPVTLLPTSGTTFNTIIGSPIELVSTQDPGTVETDRRADDSFYVISNPAKASITIKFGVDPSNSAGAFKYYTYNTAGAAVEDTETSTSLGVTYSSLTITTTASKIAVPAWSTSTVFNTIALDTTGTATVTLKVQTLVDKAATGTSQMGLYNQSLFDLVSKEETVVIYAPSAVPVTTTIRALSPGQTTFSATVVYGNSVNPYFVQSLTNVALYRNGVAFDINNSVDSNTTPDRMTTSIATTTTTGVQTKDIIYAGVNGGTYVAALQPTTDTFSAGVYSARAFYNGNAVGAASAAWDASAGPSATLSGVDLTFIDSLDAKYDSNVVTVRSGTKAITVGAQVKSGSAVLAASNVEVKLVVGDGGLDASTSITVTGATGTLTDGGSSLTAFARTNTSGQASFTITSTTGEADDALDLELYAKKSDGSWAELTGESVVWADAEFTAFEPVSAYVSGANPSVTFKVTDQWGKGLSSVGTKALSVYAEARFAGVAAPKSYSATVAVVNGQAKFTFANFAPANGLAQLVGTLYSGGVNDRATVGSEQTVNVYNIAAVDKVTIVDSFTTAVSYVDYVTGDTTDPVVAKKVSDAGLSTSEGVEISGNVLNAANAGAPGAPVTVAAKGVLFYADGVYSLDTVTTNANEFGAFSVYAIAHTVYATGTTVSVTSEGKSSTTKLVTYLPDALEADNLKFSWTLPAAVVKNTTYALVLSLTDKWGNPIATTNAAASIQGTGTVEINSSANAITRSFDKNGKATVFMRSVKDVAGPGSVAATLAAFNYKTVDGDPATSSAIPASIVTDAKATAWDESLWSNELSADIEVLDAAPAPTGKVNVGSFNGKLVVYASGLNGARISWKVGGNWGSAVATSNYSIFNRPTPRAGVTVSVEVFVNGVKQLTKSVVTR